MGGLNFYVHILGGKPSVCCVDSAEEAFTCRTIALLFVICGFSWRQVIIPGSKHAFVEGVQSLYSPEKLFPFKTICVYLFVLHVSVCECVCVLVGGFTACMFVHMKKSEVLDPWKWSYRHHVGARN